MRNNSFLIYSSWNISCDESVDVESQVKLSACTRMSLVQNLYLEKSTKHMHLQHDNNSLEH